MKFLITKASDLDYFEIKEVSTLEELLTLRKEIGEDVIIEDNWYYLNPVAEAILHNNYPNYHFTPSQVEEICACQYELQIYDDYIE